MSFLTDFFTSTETENKDEVEFEQEQEFEPLNIKGYQCDESGYFLYETIIQGDPIANEPVFHLNETDVEILAEKVGFVRKFDFNLNTWEYVENHVGETYYSKETKEKVVIEEYGTIPETLTNKVPWDYTVWDSVQNDWVVDENLLKQAIADKKAYLTELSTNKARRLKKTVSEYADDDGQHLEALYWRLDNSYPAPQLTQIAKRLGLPLKKVVEDAIKQIPPQAKRKGDYVADDVIFKNKIKMASTMKQLEDVETEINNWK